MIGYLPMSELTYFFVNQADNISLRLNTYLVMVPLIRAILTTMDVKQCDCLKHYLCIATWPGCYDWQFGRIEKMSKISFFVVTHAQSWWTVVDSTKSVSAELSDFGLWRQLKVESEIKSPWTQKTILNDIKNILY
jgi:hypothetical protein